VPRPPSILATLAAATLAAGCVAPPNDPARATRPYPFARHTSNVADMQVFRSGDTLEIVNATPRSYQDVAVWINQRYTRRIESLNAGAIVRLPLTSFADERGDIFPSAGLFRTRESVPVRMVQIETSAEAPLLCLITIRAEEIERRTAGF
jgi:hypothetical protein